MPQTRPAGRSVSSSDSSICTPDGAGPRVELSPRRLDEWLRAHGLPAYRNAQICRWIYRRHVASFAEMTDLGAELRAFLEREFRIPRLVPAFVSRSSDGTRKLLLRVPGGQGIETVLIPDPPRLTVCVSSQVGCAMGCRFCATATLGPGRNLTVAEIVGQISAAEAELAAGERVTNVVFMGMGEPLANYDGLVEAIEVLCAPWGFGLSGRRITVSTVGLLPQLERLVQETRVSVAVSLTATTDALRDRLMPVNRRYAIAELIATCRRLPIATRRRITFEYVLLAGVNDQAADAARLVRLLHGIRAKVNLIPFNPFPGAAFGAPTDETVRDFQKRLLQSGVAASVRQHRGRDIQAACGQLAASSGASEHGGEAR